MSYAVAASLSEFELRKILIDKIETNKSMNRSNIQKDLYNALIKPKRRRSGKEAESSKEPTHKESRSKSFSKGASRYQPRSSGKSAHAKEHRQQADDLEDQLHQEFNTRNDDVTPKREARDDVFLATPIDFSAFIMNRLKIDNLTQEVLTGPTYDLIKGTCKNVVELEYHLEEVFKATNNQLDWHNPDGRSYPHDLSKPLPFIPNERGRHVIPFDHFINNDLEYLKGGSSCQIYTTSITKTKATDYGQVKWIEDKVPRIWSMVKLTTTGMLIGELITRIIAVTSLKIMKWYGYTHLEEIIIRRQDDKLYKFRESDFKRLQRQEIEDMLLLLVQDKLTNLNLEEWYALNVALRMFTRRIVIQERVEDLQLGVKSYPKKINLQRPDLYRSYLRRMTAYTTYLDIQGIIYEDELNRKCVMRTNELHKFNDGTLNYVRIALSDID
ncbi:copia protein [Tanacetum coccineum]